jgi:hypothetical protein
MLVLYMHFLVDVDIVCDGYTTERSTYEWHYKFLARTSISLGEIEVIKPATSSFSKAFQLTFLN